MQIDLPVKMAVVGCGAALEHLHMNSLRRLARRGWLKVEALADPSESRRAWAKREFPNARVEANAANALQAEGVSVALIASPPTLHSEHSEIAIQACGGVLCEKPLADTVAAGTRMVQKAHAAKRMLAVGMPRRFYPCLAEAKDLIANGRLGMIRSYTYREGSVYAWPVGSDSAFRRSSAGGGVLLDKGVHVIDLLCWLFGKATVLSSADDSCRGGVEGNSLVKLQHGEIEGLMQLSWDQDLVNEFVIHGERGELLIPVGSLHDVFIRQPGACWQRLSPNRKWAGDLNRPVQQWGSARTYYECFDYQLVQVLRAVINGEDPPVSAADGLETLKLIEACYGAAGPLEQPWLPHAEQAALRRRHWRCEVGTSNSQKPTCNDE